MTQKQIKSEIQRLQDEIIKLDHKYHFSEDNVEVDNKILDLISQKIEELEVLQGLIPEN